MINTFRIKNMICNCCCELLKIKLADVGVCVVSVEIGILEVDLKNSNAEMKLIHEILVSLGMDMILDKDSLLIQTIKDAVFDIVHRFNNKSSIINKSEYIVEKTGLSYQTISKHFSKQTGVTLEKYIILNKIERIKELIETNEYTVSEVAYMMDYSSVHHLSNQFKQHTGFSISEYKELDDKPRVNIAGLG